MAQFDVCQNMGRNQVEVPFLLVVQSVRLDYMRTRLLMPLRLQGRGVQRSPGQVVRVGDQSLVMMPHELFAAPRDALGPVVASLVDDAFQIIQAIDDVISTAYG